MCGSFYQVIGDGVCVQKSTVCSVVHSVICVSQPCQPVCQMSNKSRRNQADQDQVLWNGEIAKYYWCDRLHSCPYSSTPWEGMGVCEQERIAQHQCATCRECRPHHKQLCGEIARVGPWCTDPAGEPNVQEPPTKSPRWHHIGWQRISPLITANDTFCHGKQWCRGEI